MLTRLIDARVQRSVLVSGLIWGAWHLRLILTGQYASGAHPGLSALMFLAVIAHATWSIVIQAVFDASMGGATSLWLGESGVLVVVASVIVAVVVLPRNWVMKRRPVAAAQGLTGP